MSAFRLTLMAVAASGLLMSGCYCPMLSGRYSEVGCFPPCSPQALPPALECPATCDPVASQQGSCLGRGWLGLRHAGASGGLAPSQQGPDYVSPQAKFHPVPTRPAFEPQLAYPPPQLIEPAASNPLRPAERWQSARLNSLRPH